MSQITPQKIGIYFLPLLFWIVVNCSSAAVVNGFDDDDRIVDGDGVSRWFFVNPAFSIAKKQMNERFVNSLLRNAWIG